TLGVPWHRRRFHRRREDQAIGKLSICVPGRIHPVLPELTIKLLGKSLFIEPVNSVQGPVHVPVVPRPVEVGDSFPFEPGIAAGHVTEEAARKPVVVGAASYLPWSVSGVIEDELVQISPPA